MTQREARNAVNRIQYNAKSLHAATQRDNVTPLMISIALGSLVDDIDDLVKHLDERKQATPNCRPATTDELAALCAASNVVTFRPAA